MACFNRENTELGGQRVRSGQVTYVEMKYIFSGHFVIKNINDNISRSLGGVMKCLRNLSD